jgi:ABC-2 type transport system permease protein
VFPIARDVQTGFLNRLSLTPMRGVALLAGQLGGIVTMGVIQALVYLGVGLAVGIRLASGPAGALVLLAFAVLISVGFGALGAFAALRTGSGEAVQSLFPAFFVFLFLSSMNLPRNLIEIDWFRAVATANPVSYLIECVRSLIITGWDGEALALGFGIGAAITQRCSATTLTSTSLQVQEIVASQSRASSSTTPMGQPRGLGFRRLTHSAHGADPGRVPKRERFRRAAAD